MTTFTGCFSTPNNENLTPKEKLSEIDSEGMVRRMTDDREIRWRSRSPSRHQ